MHNNNKSGKRGGGSSSNVNVVVLPVTTSSSEQRPLNDLSDRSADGWTSAARLFFMIVTASVGVPGDVLVTVLDRDS